MWDRGILLFMLSFLPLAAAVVWPWQPQLAERALQQYSSLGQTTIAGRADGALKSKL